MKLTQKDFLTSLAKSIEAIYKDKSIWTLYSVENEQKFMFYMQNPGAEGKDLVKNVPKSELGKLIKIQKDALVAWRNDQNPEHLHKMIKTAQKDIGLWLATRNPQIHPLFDILKEKGLLTFPVKVEDYIQELFPYEFYISDVIKERGMTKDVKNYVLSKKDGKYKEHCKLMEKELENLSSKFIFVFGALPKKILYNHYYNSGKIKCLSTESKSNRENLRESRKTKRDSEKITFSHGLIYELNLNHRHLVMPLVHFSKNTYSHLIYGSYYRDIEKELKNIRKLSKRYFKFNKKKLMVFFLLFEVNNYLANFIKPSFIQCRNRHIRNLGIYFTYFLNSFLKGLLR